MKRTVFIDRDGVINKDPAGWTKYSYVTKPEDFIILPGVVEGLKKIKSAGMDIIIISNQGGVSKGYYSKDELDAVNKRMIEELKEHDIDIKKVYYCVHQDSDNCDCRKPKTGLFEQAKKETGINPQGAYFIGDGRTDVEAGKKLGMSTILVLSGKSSKEEIRAWDVKPDHVCDDLNKASDIVLQKNILILYATAGIGHKKAAFSIKEAFLSKGVPVSIEDSLHFTSPAFRFLYLRTYLLLVRKLSPVWAFFYYILDIPWFYGLIKWARRLNNKMNCARLEKHLVGMDPSHIISTHFLASDVASDLKKKGKINSTIICVITDYKGHMIWFEDKIDYYVVGSEYTKKDLVKRGIPEERIKAYGIPCGRGFYLSRDKNEMRKKFGLNPDKKTVFVLSGGFGVGPVKEIARELSAAKADFQIIVVCGYNELLKKEITAIAENSDKSFKVSGFVDNVDELMAASDILITKPGGMSVTEALASSLPMILVSPIPGQETRNAKFLVDAGAAITANQAEDIESIIEKIFNTGKIKELEENTVKIRLINSGEKILDELCG